MEKNVIIKPFPVPSAVKVAPVAPTKGAIERELKAAAKTTEKICAAINKKLLTHKSATMPEITQVNGVSKPDMMKLVELLDTMGSTTYSTVCALRDLHNRMK